MNVLFAVHTHTQTRMCTPNENTYTAYMNWTPIQSSKCFEIEKGLNPAHTPDMAYGVTFSEYKPRTCVCAIWKQYRQAAIAGISNLPEIGHFKKGYRSFRPSPIFFWCMKFMLLRCLLLRWMHENDGRVAHNFYLIIFQELTQIPIGSLWLWF